MLVLSWGFILSNILIYRAKPSEKSDIYVLRSALRTIHPPPERVDYAHTVLYTHNFQLFQDITRKIRLGYPQNNYACNTLAIVSAEMLFTPPVVQE
jgi:hypothetical protein